MVSLRAFDTGQTPFTAFAADNPAFAKDKAIRAALSFLKTGHVHAKFQWHRWQTGSDALQLPFALVTAADSLATATDAEVPVGPEPPSHAGPKTPPEPEPGAATASDTASVVASDEDAAARQTESPPPLPPPEESVPGVASPEPPESSGDVASSQPATPQPTQARARRTRHQKQPSTNGTPKRSRVQPTRHQRQLSKPQAQKGSMPVTPASGTVSPEETPPAMVTVIKELEDVQEEYRVFHTLVRRAARDLWSEMGNDWPPNPASSTRYGKRRKVV
ncbi:hypothetical protein H4R19_001553 [Coemansia spiralis]|nr:hypothetical protein H4R19_001553 [Coemansia spiralis]